MGICTSCLDDNYQRHCCESNCNATPNPSKSYGNKVQRPPPYNPYYYNSEFGSKMPPG